MPRPVKCRRVCSLPGTTEFHPLGPQTREEAVILTVDEYEAIRLIDHQDFSQEECSCYMEVARTTVQQIYTSARKKLAQALVEGRPLLIQGGSYCLCEGPQQGCKQGPCRQYCHQHKEVSTMKIALPLDENKIDICPAFARAPYFLFVEAGQQQLLPNPATQASGGAGVKAAQFLVDQSTDILLTPRCGQNAAEILQLADIKIYKTEFKEAEANLAAHAAGQLALLTHFHAGFHGAQ